MRYPIALALAIIITVTATPTLAHAQPPCPYPTGMAGVYVDPALPMRAEVYPCGGVSITWDNQFGRHEAQYISTTHLPGGGVALVGHRPDPIVGYLDNAYRIGVKPGSPGFVQVMTVDPYGNLVGFYDLRKLD